jgi:hypothetical protein
MSTENVKIKTAPAMLEATGPLGQVQAVIASLNVKDADGDVATSSTFTDGEEVVISSYNHASMTSAALPVGKGIIRVTQSEVTLAGQFFYAESLGA